MVTYWFNDQVLSSPVRVHGAECVYRVHYCSGAVREFRGVLGSLVVLRRLLCARLCSDSSLWLVQVYLPSFSRLLVCECSVRSRR